MSVLISISSHMFSRRTVTSLASINARIASCTCRSMRISAPGIRCVGGWSRCGVLRRESSLLIFISAVGVMPTSGLSPPLPASFSPMFKGCMLFGAPLNAAIIASESTRNFPSLTDDMAYITVNSANNSVTRSP